MNKHILPLLAFFAFAFSTASAQTTTMPTARAKGEHHGKQHGTPTERAAHKAEKMTKELGLSSDQHARVQQILAARAQEMDANRQQQGEQRKANHAKYDAQLKEVLTADQYTKYTQQQAERMKKHHNGKGHGPHDGPAKLQKSKVKVK